MPDQEAQEIYAELRRRGVFQKDPEAAQIAQELVKRGVLRDLSGGSAYPSSSPSVRSSAPAASPSPWGTDEESQGAAPTIGQQQSKQAAKRITGQGETAAGTINPVFGAALQVARGQKNPALPIAPRHDDSSISQGRGNLQETQESMRNRLGQAARRARFGAPSTPEPTEQQARAQQWAQSNPLLSRPALTGAAIADLSPDEQMRVDRANLTGLAPEHRGFAANIQDMRERRKAASEAVQNSILPLGAALLTGGAGAALELPALLTGAGAIGVGALAGKGQDTLNQAIDPEEFRRQQERASAFEEKDPFGALLFQNIAGLPLMAATPLAERAAGTGLNALIGTGLDAAGRAVSGQPQDWRKSVTSGLLQGIINPELRELPLGGRRGVGAEGAGGAPDVPMLSQADRISLFDARQQRNNGHPADLSYLGSAAPSRMPSSLAGNAGDVPGALYANQSGTAPVARLHPERAPQGRVAPDARASDLAAPTSASSPTPPPVYLPATNRQELAQAFADPRTFGYHPDFAGRVADTYHSIATQWAKDTGRPVEDWYSERIDSVAGGGEALAQELARRAGKTATGQEKGATFFNGKNSRAIIAALSAPDESTALHELGHVLWHQIGQGANGPAKAGDFERLGAFYGVQKGDAWTVGQKEAFAQSFEHYLSTGEAPNPSLRPAFATFKQFLGRIYNSVKAAGMSVIGRKASTRGAGFADVTPFSPEIKAMMDRYFGDISDARHISTPEAQPTEPAAVQSNHGIMASPEPTGAGITSAGVGRAAGEEPATRGVLQPVGIAEGNRVGAEGGDTESAGATLATGGRGRGADYGRDASVGARRPVRLVDGVPAPPEELATPQQRQAAKDELFALREKVLTKSGAIKARASAADVGRYNELLLMGDEFQAFKKAKQEYDARGASDEAGQATAPASAVSEPSPEAAAELTPRRSPTDNSAQYEVPQPPSTEPAPLDLDITRPIGDVVEDVLKRHGYGQQEAPAEAPRVPGTPPSVVELEARQADIRERLKIARAKRNASGSDIGPAAQQLRDLEKQAKAVGFQLSAARKEAANRPAPPPP